jgi:hypothetical protein
MQGKRSVTRPIAKLLYSNVKIKEKNYGIRTKNKICIQKQIIATNSNNT